MRIHWLAWTLLVSYIFLPHLSKAQDVAATPVLEKSLWRIGLFNFIRPGISHELRLARTLSLQSAVALRTNYISQGGVNRPTLWYRSVVAQAGLSARYYYNLDRRLNAGRDIRYNSGNYVSVGAYYLSPALLQWGDQMLYETTYPAGYGNRIGWRALWGIQRNLPPKRFYYDLAAGLQLNPRPSESRLHGSFTVQVAIGYSFPK